MCYDFTATPFIPTGRGVSNETLYEWIVSDFSLNDAIESGLVKTPRVAYRDDGLFKEDHSRFRHIYMDSEVKANLNRKTKPEESLPDLVRNAYFVLGKDWLETKNHWEASGSQIPPVMITVCNRTETAARIEYSFRKPSAIMKAYSRLTSSEKKLSRVFMTLMIPNMNQEKGMYPEEIHKKLTEISKLLFKESKGTFLKRPSTQSNLLKEFENWGIFSSIKGKKKIKQESPKSLERKPKVGRARRQGYPIVYELTGTVQEYKKILSNPQCVYVINNRLQKYGILEAAYDLISKHAFYIFKTGDEKMYDFLQTFKVMFPKLDPNAVPDSKAFKEQINAFGKKELEKLRKELVQHLLKTPNSSVILIFSLTKLAGS